MKQKKFTYIIGIDEAGRGPLAGPVAVGGVCIKKDVLEKSFKDIKDSKQLSPAQRDSWFAHIRETEETGLLRYRYSFSTSQSIDTLGIVPAVEKAIKRVVNYFNVDPEDSLVLLDGGLSAPRQFIHQETVIKGDEKEPVIALASIIAKVMRDRTMIRYGQKFPLYGFERHKGYGTRAHRGAIKRNGPSPIHRRSFIHF